MRSAAAATLADLSEVFSALGLRWYVFDAQAVIYYGTPRATADVDVTVELSNVTPSELVNALASVGIVPRITFDESFVLRTRVLPMTHQLSGMGVDIVLAGPGPEEMFLANAREVDLEGVSVRMASPTDLVVMKALAGRPKDIDDLVSILRSAPEGLDVGKARSLLCDLQAMLDQSDVVPVFDRAVRVSRG